MRNYNASYMLYMSDEQREFIQEQAKRKHLSAAQYCRSLIQAEIDKQKEQERIRDGQDDMGRV